MQRLLFTLFVAASGLALAQTGGGTGTIPLQQVYFATPDNATVANGTDTFGPSECNDTLTVNWTNSLTTISLYSQCSTNAMSVWVTQGSCLDAPAAGDLELNDIPGLTLQSVRTGTFSFVRNTMPGFTSDGGVPCGTTGLTLNHKVCGSVVYATSNGYGCSATQTYKVAYLNVVYDTEPPSPPTLKEVIPQDRALKVTFSTSDAETIVVQARKTGTTDTFEDKGSATVSTGSDFVLAKGLVNYTEYDMQLIAVDGAGNRSVASDIKTGTPIAVCGFLCQYYRQEGTDENRGCSTGAVVVPLLAGLWALRRRSKSSKRSQS